MKKLILRAVASIALMLTGVTAMWAQGQMPELPADPAVRTGVLDNGLTYIIRHNETPKGQADFFIAQKVGSILEEENQRGLAHFLEHMCFNGTENFPDKGIINWLESVGVKFGQNLNAYTSIDETVYNISNVPVARKSVQDSCLLILHDWSCALTLDPAEIDAERGVIHEEWRQAMSGEMRVLEQLLPKMYPDSRYGERLPIGTMEVVDNFPPQAIVDYYHTWYRPDQQGIIVVGDIDVDYIEGKIKEIFSPIKMPANPKEREYFTVDETPGTIYAIGSDKEISAPDVELVFKTDALYVPAEYRNTPAFLAIGYMKALIQTMMNYRLAELRNNPDCEFARTGIQIGNYYVAKTLGALSLDVVCKDNDILPAVQQAYRELLRAVRGGFTVGEYERARTQFLAAVEAQYEQRNDRENTSYCREYVDMFVDGDAAPGIEMEKQYYDQLAMAVTVDQLNQVMKQMVTEDNRVVLALIPDAEGYSVPTEEQFAAALESVDEEELEPYKDEMRTDPLIPSLPKPGKIAKENYNKQWDATEYTLSNGVKVIVKPTDFKANEIRFGALAIGKAMSTLNDADAASIKFLPYAMMVESYNDYSNSDIKKYLQGKQIGYDFSFDAYTRNIEGESTVKDLPTAMEMLYAFFTGFNIKENEFAATQNSIAGQLANQESNPQYIFQKDFYSVLFQSPMRQVLTSDDVRKADVKVINQIIKDMTMNAADYTFVFTGSIDLDTFIPLMNHYIATLPANAKKASKAYKPNLLIEPASGKGLNEFTTKMETPQTWALIVGQANMPYNAKNKILTSVAAQVLSKRLLNKVREEMGATYSIGAQGIMSRASENNVMFQIGFPMKPEMKNEVLEAIKTIYNTMAQVVTAEEVNPIIEFMQKEATESLTKNEDWTGAITATTINGVPTFLETQDVLKTITPQDVMDFMKQVIAQDQYRVIILDPEGLQEAGN